MLSLMESGGVAFFLSLFATPFFRKYLAARSYGQHIHSDVPAGHLVKEGTPTMGGVVIVVAAVIGYVCSHFGLRHETFSSSGLLIVGVMVCSGLLGLADDFLGIRNARNLGLNKRGKLAGQLVIAIAFAVLATEVLHTNTNLSFTRTTLPGWHLGPVGWSLLAVFMLVATANAVNFSDGLDGLAAGSATFCFAVLGIIGYWQFRHVKFYYIPQVRALDMSLVAVALVGACLGFLWWNAAPARIHMGDTGSLAIGTSLAALCLLMNLDLLMVIIGGLFVGEAASVVLQVFSFRVFHRRIFRMAPIHHHFELRAWPETTITIRFWILSGLLAALGLGIFYGDYLKIAGL